MKGVIPVAVEGIASDVELGDLGVGDLAAGRITVRVEGGINRYPFTAYAVS